MFESQVLVYIIHNDRYFHGLFGDVIQWRRKLENFEGDGDEKIGVKGGLPQSSSFILQTL